MHETDTLSDYIFAYFCVSKQTLFLHFPSGNMKALQGEALKMFTFATDPIRITPRVI